MWFWVWYVAQNRDNIIKHSIKSLQLLYHANPRNVLQVLLTTSLVFLYSGPGIQSLHWQPVNMCCKLKLHVWVWQNSRHTLSKLFMLCNSYYPLVLWRVANKAMNITRVPQNTYTVLSVCGLQVQRYIYINILHCSYGHSALHACRNPRWAWATTVLHWWILSETSLTIIEYLGPEEYLFVYSSLDVANYTKGV